jgi:hypothetical protein
MNNAANNLYTVSRYFHGDLAKPISIRSKPSKNNWLAVDRGGHQRRPGNENSLAVLVRKRLCRYSTANQCIPFAWLASRSGNSNRDPAAGIAFG